MPERPYTLLSCSVSIDGYLGDHRPRLALSNEADFDRVDAVRASCDAIMVGAVTVIFIGDAASPRASRSARSACERISSRGLSVRTVTAPTKIASHEARTSSTRWKSASLDSARRGVWSPR